MRSPSKAARVLVALLPLAGHLPAAHAQPTAAGLESATAPAPQDDSAAARQPRGTVETAAGVRASQAYSSNPLRQPSGQERDGFTTEISPYLRSNVDGARFRGNLDVSLRNFYRTETKADIPSSDTLRYALSARGHYTAPGERFGVMASGLARDVNISPFGMIAEDPALVPTNRQRFSMYSLSPYVTGHLGTIADYRAEITTRATQLTGGGNLVDRTDNRIMAYLNGAEGQSPWSWSANGSRQHRDFGNGFSMGRGEMSAVLRYRVLSDLRLGVSGNYSQIDRLRGTNGKDNGWGPGVELDWAPSSRTRLTASWADMYYGPTSRLDVTHRIERFSLGLKHQRTMMTSSDASVLLFNPAQLFSGGGMAGELNPVYQALLDRQLIDRGDGVLGTGVVTDAATLMQQNTASIAYAGPKLSVHVIAHRNQRERSVTNEAADVTLGAFTGQLTQRGLSSAVIYSLGPSTKLRLTGRRLKSDSDSASLHSELTTLQAVYEQRLSGHATAGLGVRRTIQKSSNASVDYRDSTLFGTVDVKF